MKEPLLWLLLLFAMGTGCFLVGLIVFVVGLPWWLQLMIVGAGMLWAAKRWYEWGGW